MSYLKAALQRHKAYLRAHPFGFVLLLIICATILCYSYTDGSFVHALGYLFAIWLGALVTDVVVTARPVGEPVFVIHKPIKQELIIIAICTLLGLSFLLIRFLTDWAHLQGVVKLLAVTLIIFTFPIALALIFLFVFKYKFKDLGININYWYLPLLLHLIWGGITMAVAPEKSHWIEGYAEYGVWGFLVTGILGAALSEEFSRMLIQTRVGAASRNMYTGIFVAAVVWSAMHLPVNYSQDPANFTAISALLGVVYLVPLGIFWGYITYRTQSLLPVILMHGFNLWGLQNF